MYRTPAKKDANAFSQATGGSPRSIERPGSSQLIVRRSIGEWEAGRTEPQAKSPANPNPSVTPPRPLTTAKKMTNSLVTRRSSSGDTEVARKPEPKYPNLTAEARACLNKAKLHLGNSRNLKTEIKTEVLSAINRLFEIVKESEKRKSLAESATALAAGPISSPIPTEPQDGHRELQLRLEENSSLIKENIAQMERLKEVLVSNTASCVGEKTYASAAAAFNNLDVVNKNLFDSKNFLNKKTDVVLTKLLNENKFNSDIISSVGKNSDVVNNFEDITIMDDNGHLKNLKFKSALPKAQFDNLINSEVSLTKVSDKVSQIDRPVTESYEDEVEFEAGGQKPKFLDELGRK
ncbi:hypothetical protein PYW08_011225 [Mythimna loreyi]|uniref:Uncharacterized protein n=1 Tax=Mythimna loreyi TaxID=667449 RepID=A0ACC2Q2Y8_9NEOP|nr:hypothetical protein PYW08_011225 [Mythimna loreyi]